VSLQLVLKYSIIIDWRSVTGSPRPVGQSNGIFRESFKGVGRVTMRVGAQERRTTVRTRYPRVAVVIPCLNEAAAIADTVKSIPIAVIKGMGYETEILVVDNGSSDNTAGIARRTGARVVVEPNRGKGRAFRAGIAAVKADYIFMIDGDNTYPSTSMLQMLDKCDCVTGSRLRGQASEHAMTGLNRAGNHMLSLMASLLCRRRVTDVCTGLWGFKANVVQELGLTANGFELEVQLFMKLAKAKHKHKEIPIAYRPRLSPSKLRVVKDGLKIGWTLIRESFSTA
jgi:glycosyltransferase involved in cell wall biosynthesis